MVKRVVAVSRGGFEDSPLRELTQVILELLFRSVLKEDVDDAQAGRGCREREVAQFHWWCSEFNRITL